MRALLVLLLLVGCKPPAAGEVYGKIDELVARDLSTLVDRPLRAHGFVKRGTISASMRDGKPVLTFIAHHQGAELRVVYQGGKPQNFEDQAEVVAKGRLVLASSVPNLPKDTPAATYVVVAEELLAKCPTNYDRNAGSAPARFQ